MTWSNHALGRRAHFVGHFCSIFILIVTSLVTQDRALGQCNDLQWRDRFGIAGVNGEVRYLEVWDPDGPGPGGPHLLVAGSFNNAGGLPTRDIASFDGTNWLPMPLPANQSASRFTVFQNHIVAMRSTAGSPGQSQPIRWSGAAWESLGPPVASPRAFGSAGGRLFWADSTDGLFRWSGSDWMPYSGPTGVWISRIGEVGGRLYVTGTLNGASGPARLYQQTSDEEWTVMGGAISASISSVVEFQGMVHIGGHFTTAGGVTVNGLARLNGENWEPVGGGLMQDSNPGTVSAMVAHGGELYVAGSFNRAGGMTCDKMARWNGVTWVAMRAGVPAAALVEFNDLVVGGSSSYFVNLSVAWPYYLAAWRNGIWTGLGRGFLPTNHGPLNAIVQFRDRLFLGGYLGADGSLPTVAYWDGTRLIGTGRVGWVENLIGYNDQLIAVGNYMNAPPFSNGAAMAWNGSVWSPIGAPGEPIVGNGACAAVYHDELVIGGMPFRVGTDFVGTVARWDGTTWASLGGGTQGGHVREMVVYQDRLIACGSFSSAGGMPTPDGLAAWNGTSWSTMGQIGAGVDDLCLFQGELYASTASGPPVRRWDGLQWLPVNGLLSGRIDQLAEYDGMLYGFGPVQRVDTGEAASAARWDGTDWALLLTPPGFHSPNQAAVYRGELYLAQSDPQFDILGPACPRGDLNGDGIVSGNDVTVLAAALLEPATLGDSGFYLADVNGDGRVDGLDVAAFVERVTGP